ncbi:MAG: antibiotic biosynthesis monooxygenase family protein [Asticcacaulis sp.]
MITEIARLRIDALRSDDFEAAVAAAAPLFRASEGCHGMALDRIIEEPGTYVLRVSWETLEHHTVIFRGSENFQKWRALVGPFFIEPPEVAHNETRATYF